MNITFKGNPITIQGNVLKVGDRIPSFNLVNNSLKQVSLSDTQGVRVFVTVPSLDTPVCDLEAMTFNDKATELDGVSVYIISMDLPFAQSRWCLKNGAANITTLSDYKDRDFAKNFGTYIKELGLLTRAAFVVDSSNTITYIEYVPEVTTHPNYDAIIDAAKTAK